MSKQVVVVSIMALALTTTGTALLAQGGQQPDVSGANVVNDPARSSAKNGLGSTTTGESRSGSGTASSGGKDANGDQGRDAMPGSGLGVRPIDKQNKK